MNKESGIKVKRKTKAEICAIVFKKYCEDYEKQYGIKMSSWNVGDPDPGFVMYEALIAAGFKGPKIQHPLNRLDYVSRCLALDCHKSNGFWKCTKTITYPGITRNYCNIYELRD